jgi:SnoaL-like domain
MHFCVVGVSVPQWETVLAANADGTGGDHVTQAPSFEDWIGVVGALNRLATLFDGREWDRLDEVILPDATCYGDTGIDALVTNNLRRYLGGCGPSQHLLSNYDISVDGDHALSHTKIRAFHVGAGERSHLSFESIGVYHDHWVRTPGGWRLSQRSFQVDVNIGDMSVLQPG